MEYVEKEISTLKKTVIDLKKHVEDSLANKDGENNGATEDWMRDLEGELSKLKGDF